MIGGEKGDNEKLKQRVILDEILVEIIEPSEI